MSIENAPPPLSRMAFSLREVGELTGICRSVLYRDIKEGKLRAVKHGGRTLVLRCDLENYVNSFVPIAPKPPRPESADNTFPPQAVEGVEEHGLPNGRRRRGRRKARTMQRELRP